MKGKKVEHGHLNSLVYLVGHKTSFDFNIQKYKQRD
jgi:hypothetical protein